jgi:hypothetical protein
MQKQSGHMVAGEQPREGRRAAEEAPSGRKRARRRAGGGGREAGGGLGEFPLARVGREPSPRVVRSLLPHWRTKNVFSTEAARAGLSCWALIVTWGVRPSTAAQNTDKNASTGLVWV